jgi:phospholipid transport system substrate-binding protein
MVARRMFAIGLGSLLFGAPLRAIAQKKGPAKDKEDPAQRVVKQLVLAVREGRDADAIRLMDGEGQARFIFGDDASTVTEAMRNEFVPLFGRVFAAIAFPRVRENFKNLASINYEPAEGLDGDARVRSTVVLDHPLKKQEIKLECVLRKTAQGWRVLDVKVLGDSVMTAIRDDQIRPLVRDKGWDAVMSALRTKDAELAPAKR